jgi:ketosteroid isomerase-like protein
MTGKDPLIERLEVLEARLREVEDEREIRELLSRYGFHADARRDEAYLELWTDDGVFDVSMDRHIAGVDTSYQDGRRFVGKEQLREMITDPDGHARPGVYGHTLHVQGNNVVVHIDGDEAVANAYSLLVYNTGEGLELRAAGTNHWGFRREDGRWRITERRRRAVGDPATDENLSATPA